MVTIKRIPSDKNEGVMAAKEWDQEIKLTKLWVHAYGVSSDLIVSTPLGGRNDYWGKY